MPVYGLDLFDFDDGPDVASIVRATPTKLREIESELSPMIQLSTICASEGSGRPCFLIPGIHTYASGFAALGRALEKETNAAVYAIELLTENTPLDSVPAVAAWIIEQIVAEYPQGPCVVAGHSLGARIATEVALQLAPSEIEVQMVILIDDGPSFEPHRFADTWDDASPVARIERFFAGWFASCTASAFGLLPELIQSGRYDEVANLLQACDRSELHPSFETVATGGWKTNASFWDRAWRLARFSNRVSAGSLLSHCPSQTTEVPVLLVRTDADNRAQFLKRIAATCKVPTDTEARDFGCSAVFQGVLSVAIIPDLDHMAITTIGGKATARVIGEKLAAIDHR